MGLRLRGVRFPGIGLQSAALGNAKYRASAMCCAAAPACTITDGGRLRSARDGARPTDNSLWSAPAGLYTPVRGLCSLDICSCTEDSIENPCKSRAKQQQTSGGAWGFTVFRGRLRTHRDLDTHRAEGSFGLVAGWLGSDIHIWSRWPRPCAAISGESGLRRHHS